jgi:hypothetical protein
MKRSTKFFGKKYYTIEDSIFSFLFRDIFIIGFPRSPYFIYVMKPLLLLVLAYMIYAGYLESNTKNLSVFLLIISSIAIMHARRLQKKFDKQEENSYKK